MYKISFYNGKKKKKINYIINARNNFIQVRKILIFILHY